MGSTTQANTDALAGNVLKLARIKQGLSQRELAVAAGVAQSTIARIESGSMQPTLPVLCRILAGADLEARIHLDPYDDHDDVLDASAARLTAEQWEDVSAEQDRFIEALHATPATIP